jgi:hypothetical protein
MLSVCLCIPSNNFWKPEQIFMKLSMYIMATGTISTAHFINPSYQSLCLYMYRFSLLGNGSVKTLPLQQIHKQQ